jgi:DNA-binding MarR family transcriptional regulator
MAATTTPSARALADLTIGLGGHLVDELEEALADHGLTRTSFLVLDALDRSTDGALGQGELVARVRRTAGSMSVRLGRLEHAGLISRTRESDDRRNVTVTLTEAGRTLVAGARDAYEARAARLVTPLADAEAVGAELQSWMTFFEPGERAAPRLGIAVAPAAIATRMRRAVGLEPHPGVLVVRVSRDGPAARAGIDRGDLVAGAGGVPVLSVGDLERAVLGAGKRVTLDLVRGTEPRTVDVDLD